MVSYCLMGTECLFGVGKNTKEFRNSGDELYNILNVINVTEQKCLKKKEKKSLNILQGHKGREGTGGRSEASEFPDNCSASFQTHSRTRVNFYFLTYTVGIIHAALLLCHITDDIM